VLGVVALLAAIAGLWFPPTTRSSAQVEEGATMTVLRGQVAVVHPDGSAIQPAPSGTIVNVGDEIRTLGNTGALITFFVGTEIELAENTVIAIQQVSRQGDRIDVSLRQVLGATINRVQTVSGSGSTYRIDVGGAVAVVRGTTFAVIGPITTSVGDIVILVCLADCGPTSTFAGCPLQPFLGYGVVVNRGRVESSCIAFAVARTADLLSAAFEAITTIEQELQGDTHGAPSGQVPPGQRQEIEAQNRPKDDDDPPKEGPPPSPTGTPSPSATPSPSPTGTPSPSATPTPSPTPTIIPSLSINDVTDDEGNDCESPYYSAPPAFPPCGTTPFVFTVTLSAPSTQTITVHFATRSTGTPGGGTAIGGGPGSCASDSAAQAGNPDYESTSGTLTFPPGTVTRTITVLVCADEASAWGVDEGDENFFVDLSAAAPAGAVTTLRQTGQGAIVDDDDIACFSFICD
jgi:hypothetical protein